MRNLEGVRKNKPILNSEAGSIKSMMSRISKATTTRASQPAQGQLTKIEEQELENQGAFKCEVTGKDVEDEADISMALETSKILHTEDNLQKAYNDYRFKNNLDYIDFKDPKHQAHFIKLSPECLLDCFQARRVDKGDYELDEVSGYRGSILQGIGLKQEGRYGRK